MTTSPPAIEPSTTLADLVNAHPQLAATLEGMQLDYCCGGQRSLAQSCLEAGIDIEDAIRMLLEDARSSPAATSTSPDLLSLSPSALADHIEQTHHAFLRGALPRLSELAARVESAHVERHPELADIRQTFETLRADLEPHLDCEEQILFPLIREIDAAQRSNRSVNGTLKNPVTVLHDDHEDLGAALARLRKLTDTFTAPDDACASYRAFFDGLHDLADDTHLHVHKENNMLFPRAIERERELRKRTPA